MKTQNRKNIEIMPIKLDMPKALHQAVKALAEIEDKSRTFVIVEAIQEFITKKEKTQ